MKKLFASVLCAVMLVCVGFNLADALTFDEYRAKANEFMGGTGEPAAFIKLSTDVLTKDVGDDTVFQGYTLGMRAHAYWRAGDLKNARVDAQKAIEVAPKGYLGYIVMGDILAQEGKLEEAAIELDKLVALAGSEEDKQYFTQLAANLRAEANAITPVKLWEDFDSNEVAAEDAYKDKIVILKGKISAITTSATGAPQVKFNIDQHGFTHVVCEFDKDNRSAVAKLGKGQEIIIAGTCRGMMIKDVYLASSQIVE